MKPTELEAQAAALREALGTIPHPSRPAFEWVEFCDRRRAALATNAGKALLERLEKAEHVAGVQDQKAQTLMDERDAIRERLATAERIYEAAVIANDEAEEENADKIGVLTKERDEQAAFVKAFMAQQEESATELRELRALKPK